MKSLLVNKGNSNDSLSDKVGVASSEVSIKKLNARAIYICCKRADTPRRLRDWVGDALPPETLYLLLQRKDPLATGVGLIG